MSCFETFGQTLQDYGLRSLGVGERLLPRTDITICDQIVLIGSGMLWNIYFGLIAVAAGFFLATAIALARASANPWAWRPASAFIFVFRGSPLFLQFFFAYELFVLLPRAGIDIPLGFITITAETRALTSAAIGAAIVLFLNTSAYTAQIFHGALRATPRGDLEAAEAFGMPPWRKFTRIVAPNMLRLAWPSYTNEAIFLFHATTLVFFSSFPAWRQKGDALYYANYFADKTFNPFVPYPIVAVYFVLATLALIVAFGVVGKRLNRHLPQTSSKASWTERLNWAR